MELKDLEGKILGELTDAEKQFLKKAYIDFFDTMRDLRRRAIGYAVILGGCPVDHIGDIDVYFHWTQLDQVMGIREGVSCGLNVGPFPLMNSAGFDEWRDTRTRNAWTAIRDYIATDKRLSKYLSGEMLCADGVGVPLFVSTKRNIGGRLHDCNTVMVKAGQEIGFNASKIKGLHKMGDDFQVCTGGLEWDFANDNFSWGRLMPLRLFPFNRLPKDRKPVVWP